MEHNLNHKIKKNIVKELNQDLYKHFNIDINDADHYFGYYNGYIYKLIDRVYTKYGSKALRSEIKYITEYLSFLFHKLQGNSAFPDYILVVFYFRIFYRHYSLRKVKSLNQLSFNFN